jgi:hypothetical protein
VLKGKTRVEIQHMVKEKDKSKLVEAKEKEKAAKAAAKETVARKASAGKATLKAKRQARGRASENRLAERQYSCYCSAITLPDKDKK